MKGMPDSLTLITKVLLSGVSGLISVNPRPLISLIPSGVLLLAAIVPIGIPLSPKFSMTPVRPDISLAP